MVYYTFNNIHRQIAETSSKKINYVPQCEYTELSSLPMTKWKKDPKLWGPHLWAYLHYSSANYPIQPTAEETDKMVSWLQNLYVTIPCEKCRVHYKKHIDETKNLREICGSRNTLFKFLVDLHNKVNERNGKESLSYHQAKDIYD